MTDLFDAMKARVLRPVPRYRAIKERTGEKHGMLTVMSRVPMELGIVWLCKCDCGRFIEVESRRLIHRGSCGCLRSLAARARWRNRHAG